MLEVLVLGPLVARAENGDIPLGGGKQRDLLALLAMAGGRARTAAGLIDDLWVDPPENPRHALQVHISRLRSSLPVAIPLAVGGYRLAPNTFTVDATRFTALLSEGTALLRAGSLEHAITTFDEALGLWRGEVFDDLSDLTSLRAEGRRLERERLNAISARIDALLLSGKARSVVPELLTLTSDSPFVARFWAQALVALYLEGRSGEAAAVHDDARTVFAQDLGTGPGQLLDTLHDMLLQNRPARDLLRALWTDEHPMDSLPLSGPAEPALVSPQSSDLIGRTRELDVLRTAWRRADVGLQVVAITGDPGIGKTRLAHEFTHVLTRVGAPVLFSRCAESPRFAYQPFQQMLRLNTAGLSGDELLDKLGPAPEELIQLLPELADRLAGDLPPPNQTSPAVEQHQLFQAISGWLEHASADQPVCLIIDDLHWADPETIAFLEHLVLDHPRPIRALLVLTFRDREVQFSSRQEELAVFLRQSHQLSHLPLPALDLDEITSLVENELAQFSADPTKPAELTAQVTATAGGNPLFALELTRHYAGDGGSGEPAEQSGPETHAPNSIAYTALSGSGEALDRRLPEGLRAVVLGRLEQLTPAMREQLEYASVLGRSFDPVFLARALNQPVGELDDLLVTAVHARLIEREAGAGLSYVFCHDVLRMALYDGIAPLRRASIHRGVAHCLEPLAGSSVRTLHALAYHFSEAAPLGHSEEAIRYLSAASALYIEQRAPHVAVNLLRRARDLQPDDVSPDRRSDLLLALGVAENHAGLAGYRGTLLTAARIAADANDAERLTAAAVANNRGWYSSTAAPDRERIAIIDAALAACSPDDEVSRARLLASWAVESIRDPAMRERALAASHEARAIADDSGSRGVLKQILPHHYAVLFTSFSDPHVAVAVGEEMWSIAREGTDLAFELYSVIGLAQATMTTGDIARSDQALARAEELSGGLNEPARLWMLRSWHATREALRGDLESAAQLAFSTFELGTKTGQPDAATWFAGQQFMFGYLAGRLAEFVPAIEEQAAAEQGQAIPAWEAAYSLALAEAGRHEDARGILKNFVAEEFTQLPTDMLWLAGMAFLSATAHILGDAEAAREVHGALLPHSGLLAHNGTIDAGPVDLHLGAAALTFGDRDAARRFLLSARAWCARSNAPLWAGRVDGLLSQAEDAPALEA